MVRGFWFVLPRKNILQILFTPSLITGRGNVLIADLRWQSAIYVGVIRLCRFDLALVFLTPTFLSLRSGCASQPSNFSVSSAGLRSHLVFHPWRLAQFTAHKTISLIYSSNYAYEQLNFRNMTHYFPSPLFREDVKKRLSINLCVLWKWFELYRVIYWSTRRFSGPQFHLSRQSYVFYEKGISTNNCIKWMCLKFTTVTFYCHTVITWNFISPEI